MAASICEVIRPFHSLLPFWSKFIVYPLGCALLIISAMAVAGAFPHPFTFGGLAVGLGIGTVIGHCFKLVSMLSKPLGDPSNHLSIGHQLILIISSIAFLIIGFLGLAGVANVVHIGATILGWTGGVVLGFTFAAAAVTRHTQP